jgi:CRISPR-associated exonuclease Cas4
MNDPYLPVSAIEHWAYCQRQCMLIHAEQVWEENTSTVRGALAHATVDLGAARSQPGRRLHHSVTVWSDSLALIGLCDVVEEDVATGELSPIEHKLGPKVGRGALLQVVAQAMCLEECTGRAVNHGWVFTRESRRREAVPVGDPSLRQEVVATVSAIREQLDANRLPAAVRDKRCDDCSLLESCLPEHVGDLAGWSRLAEAVFDA